MNKKIFLSLAVAVLMAAPAFAAVQNVKVSGNITSSYLNRQDFDFNTTANGQDRWKQSLFLTQTTLRVDADLSDNVSTTVGLINERAWGSEPSANGFTSASNTEVDLYLAYVTLREFLYSPLTVTVGRQVFAFGNSFIFDATGTNNSASGPLGGIAGDLTMRTSLDAVRATFDYKPLTVDVFFGKTNSGVVTGVGTKKDDSDVYGINANYQLGDAMNTVVEAYLFGMNTGEGATIGALGRSQKLYVPGLRASTNPVKGLNVQAEAALQRGNGITTAASSVNQQIRAYAFQGMASYALPVAELEKYKPVVSGSYTYVSGDKRLSAENKDITAWNPFFENQGGGTIYNTIFNLSNLQIVNATLSASPIADVTTSLSWNGLWAAQKLTAAAGSDPFGTFTPVQPDGVTSLSHQVSSNKHLGHEYDAKISYAYTEDVTFGLNLGWFVPGRAFTAANHGTAKQAIASVGVNF